MKDEQRIFLKIVSSMNKVHPPYLLPLEYKELVDQGYLEKPVRFGQHILTEKGKEFVAQDLTAPEKSF